MKFALVLAYIGIGVLAFFVFMQSRDIKRLEGMIPPPPAPPQPAPAPENSTSENSENGTKRESVTGGELWDKLTSKAKEVKLDLTFNND